MDDKVIGSLELRIEFSFDKTTEKFTVLTHTVKFNDAEKLEDIVVRGHELTDTQVRYGILTFGAKTSIGKNLLLSSTVKIVYDGVEYPATTHKLTKGRVSSLSALFRANPSLVPGAKITGIYDLMTNTINISLE